MIDIEGHMIQCSEQFQLFTVKSWPRFPNKNIIFISYFDLENHGKQKKSTLAGYFSSLVCQFDRQMRGFTET